MTRRMPRLLDLSAAVLLWGPIAAGAAVIVAIPPSVAGPLQDAIDSVPTVGIVLDAASDENLLTKNVISGSATDVIDEGSNCWRGTTFATGTIPPGGCP